MQYNVYNENKYYCNIKLHLIYEVAFKSDHGMSLSSRHNAFLQPILESGTSDEH